MIYGYARVSTKTQAREGNSLRVQAECLRERGAQVIYSEAYIGTKVARPQLDLLMSNLKKGDTVIVTKLDRMARNTKEGLELIDKIVDLGCTLNVLNMGVFENTSMGKVMRTMMLAFAEFERDMIVQRTQEGKNIAKTKEGYREGRPKLSREGFEDAYFRVREGLLSKQEACQELGVSTRTWYRMIEERRNTDEF